MTSPPAVSQHTLGPQSHNSSQIQLPTARISSGPQSADPEKGLDSEFRGAGEEESASRTSASDEKGELSATTAQAADETAKEGAVPPSNAFIDPKAFPDGGLRAWSTVLGGFFALFVSFGELAMSSKQT